VTKSRTRNSANTTSPHSTCCRAVDEIDMTFRCVPAFQPLSSGTDCAAPWVSTEYLYVQRHYVILRCTHMKSVKYITRWLICILLRISSIRIFFSLATIMIDFSQRHSYIASGIPVIVRRVTGDFAIFYFKCN